MNRLIVSLLAIGILTIATACSTAEGDNVVGTNKDSFGIILQQAGYAEVNVQVDPEAATRYLATAKAGACTITFRKEGSDRSDSYEIIKVNDTAVDLGPTPKDEFVTYIAQADPPIYC